MKRKFRKNRGLALLLIGCMLMSGVQLVSAEEDAGVFLSEGDTGISASEVNVDVPVPEEEILDPATDGEADVIVSEEEALVPAYEGEAGVPVYFGIRITDTEGTIDQGGSYRIGCSDGGSGDEIRTCAGDFCAAPGSYFSVTAIPDEGYQFEGWYPGDSNGTLLYPGEAVSTDPVYEFAVQPDMFPTCLYAVFGKIPVEEQNDVTAAAAEGMEDPEDAGDPGDHTDGTKNAEDAEEYAAGAESPEDAEDAEEYAAGAESPEDAEEHAAGTESTENAEEHAAGTENTVDAAEEAAEGEWEEEEPEIELEPEKDLILTDRSMASADTPQFHVQTAQVQGINGTTLTTGPNYVHTPTTYYFDLGKGDYPVPYSGNGWPLNYTNYLQCMGILFPGDKVVFLPYETGEAKGNQGLPGYNFIGSSGEYLELREGDKYGPIRITGTTTKGDWTEATHIYTTEFVVEDAPIMLSNESGCGGSSVWAKFGRDENENPLMTWGSHSIRYIELPKYHPIEYHYRYYDSATGQWADIPDTDMANAVFYENKPANPEVIWAEDLSVNFVPYATGMSYSQWPDYRAGMQFTFSRPYIEGYYYQDMNIGQNGDNFKYWDTANNEDEQSYTSRFQYGWAMAFTSTFTNQKEGSETDPIVVNINYRKGTSCPATITLDANGGTINGRSEWMFNNYGVYYNYDFNPSEHIPTREGYIFDGWYKDAACTEVVSPALDNGTDLDGNSMYESKMSNYVRNYGTQLFSDSSAQHFRIYAKWSKAGAKALKDLDISGIETKTYTGSPITQSPVIKDGNKTLVEGTDYRTFMYENNINTGTAKMRIQGLGDYKGIVYKTFSIARKPVTIDFDLEYTSVEYDGTSKRPAVINFTCSEPGLAYNDTNFSTSYSYNSSASTETSKARVTVSARGNYIVENNGSTSLVKYFTITPRTITPTVELSYTAATYTGEGLYPNVTVKDGDTVISSYNYTVEVINNVEVGTATDIVTLRNNYAGTGTADFQILPATETLSVVIDETDYTAEDRIYSAWYKQPDVIVKSGGTTLTKGSDYTVSYSDNYDAGTASVTVAGINNYAGCAGTTSFIIEPFDLSTSGFSLDGRVPDRRYTGQPVEPKPYFYNYINGLGYTSLTEGIDYTASYANNINVGEASFTMTGVGNFTGSLSTTFRIEERSTEIIDLSTDATVSEITSTWYYDGSPKYPSPTVRANGITLTRGVDYELTWADNVEIGTATVTVTGVDDYTGTVTRTFEILDPSAGTVSKETQTITAADVTKTYGNAAFSLGAKTSGNGKLSYSSANTAVVTVDSTGKITIKGAGTAKITITAASTAEYYAASKTITVTVNKAAQTVTASNFTKTYGNAAFSIGAKTNGGGKLTYKSDKTAVAAVDSAGKVTIKGAGTAKITISAAATANYKAASKVITVTVNKAAQTVTAANFTKTYGNAAFSIGAKTNGGGKLTYKSDKTAVAAVDSAGKVTVKGAGTAKITISAAATANYNTASKVITVTVNKAAQTVTASNFTKTYGNAAFSIGAKTNGGGKLTFKSDKTAVAAVDSAGKVTIKGAGTAKITITAAATANYKAASKVVTVTVNKKVQTITASNVTKAVGNAAFSIGAKTNGGGKLTYKSDKTAVAAVDSSGKVTIKGVGTAKITINAAATANYKAASKVITVTVKKKPVVSYRTHVQTYGWQTWRKNGQMSGTSGEAKRLEGIEIKLSDLPYSGSIRYRTHVQSYGWQTWKTNGQMSGTSGEAKRLEGIQIYLTGELAKHYDVYYRVHAQSYGWLDYAKNGEMAGTSGLAKRLEGIEIVLVEKGGKAPGSTARPNVVGGGGKLPDNPYGK